MRHVHLDVLFHVTAAFSFALLLVAAFAKWADFWPLGMTVAALGFYVLFGNRRGVAMLSSSLFLVFLRWNISAILVSAPSCGCFGDLKVSPWITGSVDFALSVVWTIILVSLFFSSREKASQSTEAKNSSRYAHRSDYFLPLMGLLALFAMEGMSHIARQSTSDDERPKSVQGIKQVLMNEGLVEEGNEIRAGLIINPACGVCNELVSDHFDVVHFVVVADGRYRPPSGNIRVVNWSCSGGQVAFPTLVITSGESVELIAKKQVIEAVLTRNSQLYARKG